MLAPASGKHNSGTETHLRAAENQAKPAVSGLKPRIIWPAYGSSEVESMDTLAQTPGARIKPVFGWMGWRCPRLAGRAPARRQLASSQPARKLVSSHHIPVCFPPDATRWWSITPEAELRSVGQTGASAPTGRLHKRRCIPPRCPCGQGQLARQCQPGKKEISFVRSQIPATRIPGQR